MRALLVAGLLAVAACQAGASSESAPEPVAVPVPVPVPVAAPDAEVLSPQQVHLRALGATLRDPHAPDHLAILGELQGLARKPGLAAVLRAEVGPALVDSLARGGAEGDAAFPILEAISGQDFSAANVEAWRTWAAPAAALGSRPDDGANARVGE